MYGQWEPEERGEKESKNGKEMEFFLKINLESHGKQYGERDGR